MSETPTHMSRGLRMAVLASRLVFWVLLGALLVLVLAWGGLHGWIVPRIADWRGELESRASVALGVPVRIGGIVARTTGLVPSFELTDVVVLDPQGRQALRLPVVQATVSPASALRLGFDQIYVEAPRLDVRRTVDGRVLVAGIDLGSGQQGQDSAAMDWFFSQREFVLHNGSVVWTDDRSGTQAMELRSVDLVTRNPGRRHLMRIDATPDASIGGRFTLRGQFTSPLFSRGSGNWRTWVGQVFAEFDRVDMAQLRRHIDLPQVVVSRGQGALRAWGDVERGAWTGATADLTMTDVSVRFGTGTQSLELSSMSGRLGVRRLADGWEASTEGLMFRTADGAIWPGGNLRVSHAGAQGPAGGQGTIDADQLDLGALAGIASRLPLGSSTHALLADLSPKGRVERLSAKWQGPWTRPQKFQASGRISALALASRAATPRDGRTPPGRPGFTGLSADFELTERGGHAALRMADASVDLPGVFEAPVIVLDTAQADLDWRVDGAQIELRAPRIRLANAHFQGEASATWKTADPATSPSRSRFPGVLDLQGSISRAEGTQVHRYLPLAIAAPARQYVREAVQQGRAENVRVRVRGDLYDLPFSDPRRGEFRISADVLGAQLAYVPRYLQAAGDPPWPALQQINGELIFDRLSMEVRNASLRVAGTTGLQFNRVQARIPDLAHSATVLISGEGRGPLGDVLGVVNGSPLSGMTGAVLASASATGSADYRLRLELPVNAIASSRVQGSISLAGNDIQITPSTPLLGRARGLVTFSENGFGVVGAQARMMGGEVRFDGGSRPVGTAGAGTAAETVIAFRGQGTVSAEGLRQLPDLGLLTQVAQRATGTTGYSAYLGFRRGLPELSISTNLQGMALDLPAPLGKAAETTLPVRFENTIVRDPAGPARDNLSLDIGRQVTLQYLRDLSGATPRVLRGGIGVGLLPGESAPTPDEGVAANVRFDRVDVDAWSSLLADPAETSGAPAASAVPAGTATTRLERQAERLAAMSYLPTTMAVRGRELVLAGRTLHDVVVGGGRDGLNWRANVEARELNGYVEYRQPSGSGAGRVYARLARLTLPANAAREVETLLDAQPATVPALDIVVDDLAVGTRKLGRVEVEAVNRGGAAVAREGGIREWRLNRLALTVPEARLSASGNWAAVDAQPQAPGGPRPPRITAGKKRSAMTFQLDVSDSGALLSRLGMTGVMRGGKGRLAGEVEWLGSPLSLDYPTLEGQFNVNVEDGQFLKADPGLAKLLGVLSLQSLPRRLALDFRDVFSEGFSFDFLRGDVRIDDGIAHTNNLQMKGVNAAVLMEGSADIARETQQLRVVVIPEINAGTASLIAGVINPAVGLGTFLAQFFLRRPLMQAATQEFQIDGTWADPKVTRVAARPAAADEAPPAGTGGTQPPGRAQ